MKNNNLNNLKSKKCLNCSHAFQGNFCPKCGQSTQKISFLHTIGEFFDIIIIFDERFFKTINLLLFKPGKLTLAYLKGKRIRYISPPMLYFFLSIVFFICFSFLSVNKSAQTVKPADSKNHTQTKRQLSELEKLFLQKIANNIENFNKDPQLLQKKMADALPNTIFILLPIFTLLLKLIYKKTIRFAQHFIFSLHFHSIIYLFWGFALILSKILPASLNFIDSIPYLLIPVWLFIAIKVIYRQSYFVTSLKFMLLSAVYFLVFIVFFIITVLVLFLT